MVSPSQPSTSSSSSVQPTVPSAPKSVWKRLDTKPTSSPSSNQLAQPSINGTSHPSEDSQDKDSVSSKDVTTREGSVSSKDAHQESQEGHSTSASSWADETPTVGSSPSPPKATPVIRPAPLPAVNPWKMRQEELDRKRWKESQEQPLLPLQPDRVVPKPPAASTSGTVKTNHKANGIGKSEGKGRRNRIEVPAPPALEDAEAWPSPDVAASTEKEEKTSKSIPKEIREVVKEPKEVKEGEVSAAPKEPKESKKKKWEKIEVNFQYDSPPSRRGRGGKFYRNNNNRQNTREGGPIKNREDRNEDSKSRRNHEGGSSEEQPQQQQSRSSPREGLDRRAQSLSFEAGPRSGSSPAGGQWAVRGRASHDTLRTNAENWRRTSSQSRSSGRNVSGQRSGSPGSPRDGTTADQIENKERRPSQSASPNGHQTETEASVQQTHTGETTEDSEHQNQQQSGRRPYRGNPNTFPSTFPQPPYMSSPQQFPMYAPFYPSPMHTFPRSHSVPYATTSASRYPQYPQSYYPDFSRLGVQPVPVDEDLKHRIIRQVEYYFSPENLYKDMYLRKKMDSQGFVPISALVQFQRLKDISNDVTMVLHALLTSTELEVLFNSERGPLVRARHDPTKWVYPMSERDSSAQVDGPAQFFYQAHQDALRQMQEFQQAQFQHQLAFQQPPFMFDGSYGYPSAPSFRGHEGEVASPPAEMDPSRSPVSPGFVPENRKLSGEASPFVPNGVPFHPMMNGDSAYNMHAMNNALSAAATDDDDLTATISDEDVAKLTILVNEPKEKPIVPAMPVNGVKHKKHPSEEQPTSVTWRLPNTDNSQSPKQNKKSGVIEYSYPEFRSKALQTRQHQKAKKNALQMSQLYQFWADFLRSQWVPAMYTDFLQSAVDDANDNRRAGLSKLFTMYEGVLDNKFNTSLWNDFVRLAGEDYRNGHLSAIESVCRIRGNIRLKGRDVVIQDGDVSRLVEAEIRDVSDFERLRQEVKPAGMVLVQYTTGLST